MTYDDEQRHDASLALVRLRKLAGKTQQEFAHDLKTAISTIGRWETTRPPDATALLTLSRIAEKYAARYEKTDPEKQRQLLAIANTFLILYIREQREAFGVDMRLVPSTSSGWVFKEIKGWNQLLFSQYYLQVVDAFDSSDQNSREAASEALAAMAKFAQRCNQNPLVDKLTLAVTAAVIRGGDPAIITTTPTATKGKRTKK